jgi:hypothetical protein
MRSKVFFSEEKQQDFLKKRSKRLLLRRPLEDPRHPVMTWAFTFFSKKMDFSSHGAASRLNHPNPPAGCATVEIHPTTR